jgi:hypothetical protein
MGVLRILLLWGLTTKYVNTQRHNQMELLNFDFYFLGLLYKVKFELEVNSPLF